nr:hypothetical protein KPHV_87040 [Kitasatospora purpeofusca]
MATNNAIFGGSYEGLVIMAGSIGSVPSTSQLGTEDVAAMISACEGEPVTLTRGQYNAVMAVLDETDSAPARLLHSHLDGR